jgi:hypothetical protein
MKMHGAQTRALGTPEPGPARTLAVRTQLLAVRRNLQAEGHSRREATHTLLRELASQASREQRPGLRPVLETGPVCPTHRPREPPLTPHLHSPIA